ncbi:unnamed protein product [Rotaria sordida]|uniref:RanBP2-type domain-containing protein n=1 Tax=Rotaria sordida TaxID=392033 RepID=A0A815GQW0_9BILA|nr:unnamed protein product [Rotaria sordida]CAF1341601.1 unnamed protein product [Rotaria sordida]
MFHRACIENLLNTKSKTDDQRDDVDYVTSTLDKNKDSSSKVSSYTKQIDEDRWECKNCSAKNLTSEKRCQSCAKSRVTRHSSTVGSSYTTIAEEQYGHSSSSSASKTTDDHTFAKSSKKGNESDDGDQSFVPHKRSTPSTQKKSIEPRASSPSSPQHASMVYISDLPSDIKDNYELETLVCRRIEDLLQLKPKKVKCYSKLGIGVIYVTDNQLKDRLLNKIGKLALDPKEGKYFITFVETIELISYIVLNVTDELKDKELPTTKEISRRWVELHKGEKPLSCNILNAQFPNIYCVVSSALDELIDTSYNGVFSIKNFLGHIYYCADCSFFEDLPRTIKKSHIQEAIADAIGQSDLPSTSLCVQINRHSATACIISANVARLWSTKSFIIIDKNTLQKKTKLVCRLIVHPIPKSFSIQSIIKHREFNNAVTYHKLSGEHLILELSDKDVFEQCLGRGALRIDDDHVVHVNLCNTLNNPDGGEIDDDTWYEREMLEIKPDIMQFVANPQHKIFRFRWNSHIWNEQFKRVASQKRDGVQGTAHDPKNPTPDQIRHLLRVTVMLNTLAVIRKRSYMIEDHEVQLNLKNELKTIVYDHDSTLERREKLSLTKTLYPRTAIRVIRGDCLVEYGRMVKIGKRPVLLNMASSTSPGGGFRKGDGAQEENIFRRSDYCRSLDIGLDEFLKERTDRLHCSSDCRLDRISDPNNMYPMNEYGAIYTSGITVFRQSEETGYAFMETPLENVCAIAMAAYRDPELKGNLLASKYAVGTRKKIENIFAIAYHHKHDCLILSAFGCGAFKNPPEHVAKLFYSVIEQYAGFFDTIIFAIVDDHNTGRLLNPEGNFQPFASILDNQTVEPSTSMNKPNTMIGPYRLLSDGSTVGNITIFDLTPCNYGAKCIEMHNHNHANKFSHPPLCIYAAVQGKCRKTDDTVHTNSFIHRNQCRDGGVCRQINDENHNREFEHPDYCPDEGRCQNQKEDHLKQFRHLPLCEKAHKCMEYQKEVASHCNKFRHCAPRCLHGGFCVMFHDKNHLDEFQHPFSNPCPRSPFDCTHYIQLAGAKDTRSLPDATQSHCIKYAHVCKNGRNCTDKTPLHLSKTIHITRHLCPYHDKCRNINDEEHLNSFTHPNVPDIRPACPFGDKCHDLRKFDHKVSFRHPSAREDGIVQYYGSNENTNFVQNQKDNVANVEDFISKNKWKSLSSGAIPQQILNWIRTVQPIHRCSPIIFESILLHGHAMSREYMEHLKDPTFVANSVLNHSRMRRIEELKTKTCEEDAKLFVTALVALEFEKNNFTAATVVPPALLGAEVAKGATSYSTKETYEHIIRRKENKLSKTISKNDLNALRTKAIEIAQASIKLHSDPAGIGHPPDKALGNDKLVFSILGPHLGHYYGDVIIVFKREILHHPDANFSVQAATSFASGNAYTWRPWLGNDPKDVAERIKHYHRTKLHASVPGYDYATALELMALASLRRKSKTMDITLQELLDQWVKTDSHQNIEAHLPQLIPLDYIDHIYIPKNLFSALNENALKAIDAVFKHRITLVSHDGEANHEKGPFGPTPNLKSRVDYQNFVVKELIDQYKEHTARSLLNPIQGVVITIPSSSFDDHYVLPLTISQAYTQYRIENHHVSKDNITYIYWKAMNGDLMLTLSNEEIDPNEKQPNLRCLICYVAPKPTASDDDYHEHTSYLAAAHPFQHDMIMNRKSYKAKSNTFYLGCNSSDFMTYCLQIHRSTGKVVLSHAGPNGIYNHEEISCTFSRSELDLSRMEFIHVSAGTHSVSIRNLIIGFEKKSSMHPTFDKDYKKDTSSANENKSSNAHSDANNHKRHDVHQGASSSAADNKPSKEPSILTRVKNLFVGDDDTSLKPCPNNVNCLKQYSEDANDHNAKYSHPCPYSELCREKQSHLTHTHELHTVPKCRNDEACDKLDDPFHRASYRHTGRPDFLIPCRRQKECPDKSSSHRKKYSHGEQVFGKLPTSASAVASKHEEDDDHDERTPCKWGVSCHDHNTAHRTKFSHPSDKKPHQPDSDKTSCKWGAKCHNSDAAHRAKFSHPKK